MAKAAEEVGFTEIGLYANFVHVVYLKLNFKSKSIDTFIS